MLIECLVKREGVTPISIGKQVYNFMPIPTFDEKGKRVAVTTSFCDVTSEEHLKYMLSKPGQFREYVPQQGSPLKAESNPMDGFSIDKFKDSFIITDKKKNLYAGSDGKWVKDREKVSPFLSMTDAFEWLKGETAFDAMEAGAAGG